MMFNKKKKKKKKTKKLWKIEFNQIKKKHRLAHI